MIIRLGDGKHEHSHGGEAIGCAGEEETALSQMGLVEPCGGKGFIAVNP